MSKYYFVGSGIASLAGAAYLMRDGHVSGGDIVIFEESKEIGGALDAHGTPKHGYFMSGSSSGQLNARSQTAKIIALIGFRDLSNAGYSGRPTYDPRVLWEALKTLHR
jgi:protoporphyrinogen oxidase